MDKYRAYVPARVPVGVHARAAWSWAATSVSKPRVVIILCSIYVYMCILGDAEFLSSTVGPKNAQAWECLPNIGASATALALFWADHGTATGQE